MLFCFLISLSLLQYEFLGINLSYIFSFAATLFCARRFGTFRAVAVGFVSGLAASGSLSVSFALAGLGAGLLFRVSVAYALLFGGVLLSGWSVYVGGAMGFLTVFPEYVSTSLIMLPLLKRLHTEQSCEEEGVDAVAENMVSMSALAYKGSDNGSLSELESALFSISSSFRALGLGEERVSYEEYRDLAVRCAEDFCKRCPEYEACKERNPAPCAENIDIIAAKLYKNERIEAYDKSIAPVYCKYARELFEAITASAGELFEARYKSRRMEIRAEEYELFSKLVGEARTSSERERTQDSELSERLLGVFEEVGFSGGSIRVFGDRKKRFIGAGPDADGSIVTSSELRRGIEEASGVKLGVPEFYRRGDIALFECSSAPLFRVEIATAAERASVDEVSGDTVRSFESADGRFYALISDGMGSGDAASKTSRFAADFLSKILNASPKKSTALHFLNHIIRNSTDECSATVDLFELDLYKGEALFFKCGAAASYVKRGGSIFRVRSETAPIGLMKTIDAERIRVEIKGGDYVVMISDGISQSLDDAAWLFELLNKEPPERLSDFAEQILLGAKEHTAIKDDKSVAVIKIKSL